MQKFEMLQQIETFMLGLLVCIVTNLGMLLKIL